VNLSALVLLLLLLLAVLNYVRTYLLTCLLSYLLTHSLPHLLTHLRRDPDSRSLSLLFKPSRFFNCRECNEAPRMPRNASPLATGAIASWLQTLRTKQLPALDKAMHPPPAQPQPRPRTERWTTYQIYEAQVEYRGGELDSRKYETIANDYLDNI
jgi:hypothetical protein